MWDTLTFNMKVSILAEETWIDGFTLCESDEFASMVKWGNSASLTNSRPPEQRALVYGNWCALPCFYLLS